MRTVLLANNVLGARVGAHLHDRGDLLAVVLHAGTARRGVESLESLGVPVWTWPDGFDDVRALEPECLLSVLFGHLVPRAWLDVPTWKPLNLHPGYLPWNRGSAPNVWPLVDGSPAGVTLHVMSDRLDEGHIVAQREVAVRPDDVASTLYARLVDAGYDLFVDVWPTVRDVDPWPQPAGGSSHRMADLTDLDPRRDELGLIDRLRARTFPPHGAEFERDGARFRVRVEIERIDES